MAERILVIDDEQGIRHGCVRALEPLGYQVDSAATMKEGLKKIQGEPYSLVLLDVMMPDGRGIELLPTIQAQDPDTVCIIITGYATVELAVEAIKRGAYDFIAKPFDADLLRLTVDQGLEKRRLSVEYKRLQEVELEAAELLRTKEEMERLDRYKSQFILTVAHELRSPVNGAQSMVRTMVRGLAGEVNDQQKDILQRIEARLDLLSQLIDDLLDLAAAKTVEEPIPLERISLLPIMKQMVDHFSIEAQAKGVALTLDIPNKKIEIFATEDGLHKIFGNLISNAIKYTPQGGSVTVSVVDEQERVRITVTDSGIGIPENDISRIGEEFFRARNALEAGIRGTGLGLSIVHQLVERFNGTLNAKSEVGKGSDFVITFSKGVPASQKPEG